MTAPAAPEWLTLDVVLAIHEEQIAEHFGDGAPGVRIHTRIDQILPSLRAGRCCSLVGIPESKFRNSHSKLREVFDMHLQPRSVRSDGRQRMDTE